MIGKTYFILINIPCCCMKRALSIYTAVHVNGISTRRYAHFVFEAAESKNASSS